jgi:hypothetical protein
MNREKHNYKLTSDDKKTITLDYYLNRTNTNINNICDKYSISKRTLYNIVNDDKYKKELNEYITASKNNFTKKTTILIDKALNNLNDKITSGEASAKDLITAVGVLYDKNRLENNLSTNNSSININIKVEK